MLTKRIIFVLGSNLGDRQSFIDQAIDKMTIGLNLSRIKKSKIFENKALLLPGSPPDWDIDFYNIALSADINLDYFSAPNILNVIKRIESELGRQDRERWSPREIDIDIVAIENIVIDLGNKLQIPHPELFNRDFFMDPIKEIESELLQIIRNVVI